MRMIEQHKDIQRNIVQTDNNQCHNPDCEFEVQFGVKHRFVTRYSLLGFNIYSTTNKTNIYCPHHTEDNETSGEALEKAEKLENARNFRDIINTSTLPRFTLKKQDEDFVLDGPSTYFNTLPSKNPIKRANSAVRNITTEHPLLFLDTINDTIKILEPDNRDVEYELMLDDCISPSKFEEEYGNVSYSKRDYNVIETNNLTGRRKLRRGNCRVIEMNMFRHQREFTGININRCPACSWSSSPAIRGIHLVEIDGTKHLIPKHTYKKCKKLLGNINRDLIDEDWLDNL